MISQFSETGLRHSLAKTENQDFIYSGENEQYKVISLADGVSTCAKSGTGARIAGQTVTDLMLQKGARFLTFNGKMVAGDVINHILYHLEQQADADEESVNEYSSTLASVLMDKAERKLLYFSVGDSLIIASGNHSCRILAMPADSSRGCCVTTTRNAAYNAQAAVTDAKPYESVAIFSDGAWRPLFARNRLKPEVTELLAQQDYDSLKEYLLQQECMDDFSFIAMDLSGNKGNVK